MALPQGERYGLTVSDEPARWGGKVPVYVPTVGRDVDVLILGNAILGVMMHWDGTRTRPCLARSGYCEHCELRGEPDRWKGFVVAWDYRRGRNVLAEMTSEAWESCSDFRRFKGKLRGKRLQLRRQGSARNASVVAILTDTGMDADRIPPAFDGVQALVQIWSLADHRTGLKAMQDRDPLVDGL